MPKIRTDGLETKKWILAERAQSRMDKDARDGEHRVTLEPNPVGSLGRLDR